MVWREGLEPYCEAAKIAPLIVQYVQGRALDIGSGPGKAWPRMIGIDPGCMSDGRPATDMLMDGTDLSAFADESCDAVFSSHFLEDIPREKVPKVLMEWARVLKIGGHMVLYLPSSNLYPKVGEPHANTCHQWDIYPGSVEDIFRSELGTLPYGWELILSEERDQGDEYSLLIVLKKTAWRGYRENLWQRNPDGKKRALVIRYGAIGDAVVCASILPQLQKQGYHVTVNTTPSTKEVMLHDPHVDEWLIQETDFVPNANLGPYWAGLAERYDKVVNLSESVEGLLLALPGRLNHNYSHGSRRRLYDNINYLEHTHNIADVPYDFSGSRFYPTPEETEWAKHKKARLGQGGPVVIWTVNGSSNHKVYPFAQIVISWLLEKTPAHIVLYGDPGVGKELAAAIITILGQKGFDTSRVTNIAGDWKIRQSLAFAIQADLMIGPETGPLNSVSMESVPKIIYLSHSSRANLTKHWRKTTTLVPDHTPCYPCHQMHYSWDYCHQVEETKAALCASNVTPESIYKAALAALGAVAVTA